ATERSLRSAMTLWSYPQFSSCTKSQITNHLHYPLARFPYFLLRYRQRRSYAKAVGVRKEPEGDNALLERALDDALDFFCRFKITSHHESGATDFFDRRVTEVFFKKAAFGFDLIE